MAEFSPWDEPMEILDALSDSLLRASPVLSRRINDIQHKLKAIRAEHEQQQEDLDQIFAVLESIEGRNYAKAQEAINVHDI